MARAVYYLHGFASSATSTKASYQPDFATLTLTRMLDRLEQEVTAIGQQPATLIGSSLGGTLAILAAARFGARSDRLVLLAPAVLFAKEGHHLLPIERVAEWRRLL